MSNVSKFVNQLKEINNSAAFDCWVPSIGEVIKFRPMSVAQQQLLINTLSNNIADNVRTVTVANSILQSNALTPVELSVSDRDIILLQFKIDDISLSKDNKDRIIQTIEQLKTTPIEYEKRATIKQYGIEVNMEIPSLTRDSAVNACFASIIDKEDAKDQLAKLLAMQIVKFVKSVSIEDEVIEFKLSDASDFQDLLTIVNNLPTHLNNAVLLFAKKSMAIYSELTKGLSSLIQSVPTL